MSRPFSGMTSTTESDTAPDGASAPAAEASAFDGLSPEGSPPDGPPCDCRRYSTRWPGNSFDGGMNTHSPRASEIGRAHVCTPVTNAHLVCRLLLEKKKHTNTRAHNHNQIESSNKHYSHR